MLRISVLSIIIVIITGASIILISKYPIGFWRDVFPVTFFVILAFSGMVTITERLIATRKVVAFWVVIALRGFSWILMSCWALYLQVKLGHTDILIILLAACVSVLPWYRIEKLVHKEF